MEEAHQIPTFNMKAVVQETGIKSDTLRAWERRYGIPDPERTSGGHRKYSKYHIDLVKWLIRKQDEGLTIRRAVDLWHQLVNTGTDPLVQDGFPQPTPPITGEMLTQLRTEWLEACLSYDEVTSQRLLAQAFAQFPPETVCVELLQKALYKIGDLWYEGKITVHQEHFTASMANRQLEAMISATGMPTQDLRLIISCCPREEHTFGPLLLTLICRRLGWEVVYLGPNVPINYLERSINSIDPHLVILSAQTLGTAGNLFEMVRTLQEIKIPTAYGGAIFTQLQGSRKYLPAHYLGNELLDAPHRIEHIIRSNHSLPIVDPVPQKFELALKDFSTKRRLIESDVQQAVKKNKLISPYLQIGMNYLGDDIIAALRLGDLHLLTSNISWLITLIKNQQPLIPLDTLTQFLEIYLEKVLDRLEEHGEIFQDWVAALRQGEGVELWQH